MSDTPVETAVKIATMELGLRQVGLDLLEVKEDTKKISFSLGEIKNASIHTDGILALINLNQQQSTARWNDLERRREIYESWRKGVDNNLSENTGAIKMLKWIVTVLTSSAGAALIARVVTGHF